MGNRAFGEGSTRLPDHSFGNSRRTDTETAQSSELLLNFSLVLTAAPRCGRGFTQGRAKRGRDDWEQRMVALYSLVVVWPSPLVGLAWIGLIRLEMRSRFTLHSLEREKWEAPGRGAGGKRATQSAK